MAPTHTCEVAGCERHAETDVSSYDREGSPCALVVCEPCANAYQIGKNVANE